MFCCSTCHLGTFDSWMYDRPESWAVHIRHIHLIPVHDTFWGSTFKNLPYYSIFYSLFFSCFLRALKPWDTHRCISENSGATRRGICVSEERKWHNLWHLMLLQLHSGWVISHHFLYPETCRIKLQVRPFNIELLWSSFSWSLSLISFEVSPLSSYAGESLETIFHGRGFHMPGEISL